ncbi:MAG: SusD/RagB family nutrient-binding outer membrane lipoprotein [Prevotellaceae bacterium]|jgi:hypothetical protein|nr:SusD/RagB family nutrient-binding outer membrane lipoprotein [Prevotellaceae bacterium]
MKAIYKIIILVSVALLAFACTDGFEDYNTNPNRTTEVAPESLFMNAPLNTMMVFGSDNNFWIFGNYSGQISMTGGQYPTYGSDGRGDDMWNKLYLNCINPLVKIEQLKGDDPTFKNRVAIARIWKSYIFSEMVAMWGPIQYFEACKGNEHAPYDSEDAIYSDLLNQLKTSADALVTGGDNYDSKNEPVFKSDVERWRKFAHCLRLRIACRLLDYETDSIRTKAEAILNEELNNPATLISNNKENFYMNFNGNSNAYKNPYFVYIEANPTAEGTFPVIHEQLMMYLVGYNDPRLEKFCKTADFIKAKWSYLGRPSTTRTPEWDKQITDNPHNNVNQDYYSYLQDEFRLGDAKWTIISYPEIACIRAEAAYRKVWTGATEADSTYYYRSIDAFADRYAGTSIPATELETYKHHWGIKWYNENDAPYDFRLDTTAIKSNELNADGTRTIVRKSKYTSLYTDYLGVSNCVLSDLPADNPLTVNGIKYNINTDANYKRIVLQHWLALFFQGIDSWTLLRRTQQLRFTPLWFPAGDKYTVYNNEWAYLPQRLPYPGAEMERNASESKKAINMIGDKSNSIQAKLKFAKPAIAFPAFPNTASPLQ